MNDEQNFKQISCYVCRNDTYIQAYGFNCPSVAANTPTLFFSHSPKNIPQQHSYIYQFSDQATGRKTKKSWFDSRTSKGLLSSLNIQSGSASNPQSSSIGRGNPFAGGKAPDVWRFSLPLSAEIMIGWMKMHLYSPIRLHEAHVSRHLIITTRQRESCGASVAPI